MEQRRKFGHGEMHGVLHDGRKKAGVLQGSHFVVVFLETLETLETSETFGDIGDIRRHLETFGDKGRHLETFGDKGRHLETKGDIW